MCPLRVPETHSSTVRSANTRTQLARYKKICEFGEEYFHKDHTYFSHYNSYSNLKKNMFIT